MTNQPELDRAPLAAAETQQWRLPSNEGSDAIDNCYPLSYNQRSLWFIHQLMRETTLYNMVSAVKVYSHVDPVALQRAFQQLVARHAALRTSFSAQAGELPTQQIHPQMDVLLSLDDATGWDDDRLNERLTQELRTPFDLERGPLLRPTLLRLEPEKHLVVLAVHHIVTDLWSMAILLAELPQLYQAEIQGVSAALRMPRAEYVDFVGSQLEMVTSPEGERHWEYWRKHLSGERPLLELPTDRPRPPVAEGPGAAESFVIGAELTQQLRWLARASSVSLHALALAVFGVLLHRYSGQDDILVGYNTSGRSAKTARTVGYFVNPVVVRASLAEDPSFSDLLSQIHRTLEAHSEHARYPFAKLVERLHPERDLSQSPLFRVLFSWQKTSQIVDRISMALVGTGHTGTTVDVAGLRLEPVAVPAHNALFDLSLLMGDAGEELVGQLEYNTDLFDAATIDRMPSIKTCCAASSPIPISA